VGEKKIVNLTNGKCFEGGKKEGMQKMTEKRKDQTDQQNTEVFPPGSKEKVIVGGGRAEGGPLLLVGASKRGKGGKNTNDYYKEKERKSEQNTRASASLSPLVI